MAQLIAMMEKDDVFANRRSISEAMTSRNILVDGLLERLNALVAEYKVQVSMLVTPEQIPV